ncbi:hypothetical protein [Amycolatopsis suaedae]|uniref:DUF2637 domain-containing protein n=1 Tax=Amycolatopsis suaedae TaxID=2510978 RepID=A0A4Q7J0J1_9PSEU|nr:hypothetical protein [Amycolatopsis suaedae]RZQ60861.1 hypothetical protein EWH70_27570 [Amycolatopsis suaedae]
MSDYFERRRADADAKARRRREDEAAALANRLQAEAARAQLAREAKEAEREQARKDFLTRSEARQTRQDRRAGRWQARRDAVRTWVREHVLELMIYGLAVASAVMAIPSMAAFGTQVYGQAVGAGLFVLSELGMWAFAIGVTWTRRHRPGAPVWAYQLGTWVFAAVAFALNFAHGLAPGPPAVPGGAPVPGSVVHGLVMGAVSVAGVIAHQLLIAAPRRTPAERAAARQAAATARRVARAQRAALRTAVAEIDPDGTARLVFRPGRYRVRRFGRDLAEAAVPGLPVEPVTAVADSIAEQATAWLQTEPGRAVDGTPGRGPAGGRGEDGDAAGGDRAPVGPGPAPVSGGGAADPSTGSDQREPTPAKPRASRARKSRPTRPVRRSVEQLRREFADAIASGAADPNGGPMDPTSAQSIARTLRCGDHPARRLRREYESSKED